MIKTFRGRLADGDQEKIRLSTKKGKIGYSIVKLELIYYDPSGDTAENTIKIFKVKQTTITDKIDFSDGNLLAAGYIESNSTDGYYPVEQTVIFDREVFNQDIYITNGAGDSASEGVNYYLELEMMTLSDNAAAVSTLRDIRLNPQVGA
jgi:hypothetical protein